MINSPLLNQDNLIEPLKGGKIAVIPTDTIYGIVGSALIPETVEKIYKLRKRNTSKPMIILISSLADLSKFGINLDPNQGSFLKNIWPNQVSVILPCSDDKFTYLHRGTKTLAFRMPKKDELLKLLSQTGPLVAPSANFEGENPSETIEEAEKYFKHEVLYIDGGKLVGQSSTLIDLTKDKPEVVRQGSYLLKY